MPGTCSSLLQRWDEVVHAVPDAEALHSPGATYTFEQADTRSNAVATVLKQELPDEESPVGALLGHTADAVVGILAILKSDRVVVVLDRHMPLERLRLIIELAGITTCLTDTANAETAAELGESLVKTINLDALVNEQAASAPRELGDSSTAACRMRGGRDTAFIIFTSGSTGRPKGVMQTHDQLLNDAFGFRLRFRTEPNDRVALVLPYGFSAGLSVIFGALLNGIGTWSFDPRDSGVRALVSWINDQRLSTLNCTPHLLRSLVSVMEPKEVMHSLRLVSTVGESVTGRDVEAIRAHVPPTASFVNLSGSSEVGHLATYELAGQMQVPDGALPAGRVMDNKEVVLLGEDRTPVPPGDVGEIITISEYLSAGYWHDETTTAERFGTDADGWRLCRQGDLGRFDDNGDLILLGRADAAIKIRGYLVDPSEIEAALLAVDGVDEAVVIPVVAPPAPTRLIAYVAHPSGVRPPSLAALRRDLRMRLPEYMVPGTIVQLPSLPRNERGKVDRLRLPPVTHQPPSAPPERQWEIVVAGIWAEVLGLDAVGLDDDFMALGGDSLSAEELLTVVEDRFGVHMASTVLVDAPTLREFARRVENAAVALPSHPDVITLNSGQTGTPLFCFAGSGALALTFLPLSRHLRERNVYAFQAHGLERRGIPDWSVEASARRFIQIMRVIQPHGPYLLLGHSFGGLVALEIARLLTSAGEPVELVGLLDTLLPRSVSLRQLVGDEEIPYQTPRGQAAVGNGRSFLQNRIRRVLPDGLPTPHLMMRHLRSYVAGIVPQSGHWQFEALFGHGVLVSRRHKVQPYAGRCFVVFADNNPDGQDLWEPLLTGQHEFFEVPSEHTSLLREPHVSTVADILRSQLDPVGAADSRMEE